MTGEKAAAPAKVAVMDNDGSAPKDAAAAGGAPPAPNQPSSRTALPQAPPIAELPPLDHPRAGFRTRVGAGLTFWLGFVPGLIAIPTVGLYLILLEQGWTLNPGLLAVAAGVVTGALSWLVLGVFFSWMAYPARVSGGIHGELETRYLTISSHLAALDLSSLSTAPQKAAYLQAAAMRNELKRLFDPMDHTTARIGSQWVTGIGYIAAWHRVHRAEEALMGIEECSGVVQAALYDRDRLAGSRFRGRDDTLNTSALAISTLDFTMKPIVGLKADATPAPTEPEMARIVLVDIKKAVNEYRDALWESLVYLKRRTAQGLLFVGLTGYLVVAIALIMGAAKEAVVAASAFYLSGAMIGLFHAAYLEYRRRVAVEDYGLYWTRMLLLPVIAGIAGVIGAGLTAVLVGKPFGLGMLQNPDLGQIFNLGGFPLGVVSAAVFGLTPGLLLDRIKALGDEVKSDIVKSDPSGSSKADDSGEKSDEEKSDGEQKTESEEKSTGQEKSDAANNTND